MKYVSIMEQSHHFLENIINSKLEGCLQMCHVVEKSLLFSSDTKFDSGSGWPSFWKPISEEKIEYISDTDLWHGSHRGKLQ